MVMLPAPPEMLICAAKTVTDGSHSQTRRSPHLLVESVAHRLIDSSHHSNSQNWPIVTLFPFLLGLVLVFGR